MVSKTISSVSVLDSQNLKNLTVEDIRSTDDKNFTEGNK